MKDTDCVYNTDYLWAYNLPGNIGYLYKKQLNLLVWEVQMTCKFCISVWGVFFFFCQIFYMLPVGYLLMPAPFILTTALWIKVISHIPQVQNLMLIEELTTITAQDSRVSVRHSRSGLQETKSRERKKGDMDGNVKRTCLNWGGGEGIVCLFVCF